MFNREFSPVFWVQNSAQASVLQREVGRFYEASCLQLPPGAKKKKKLM